MTNSFRDAKGRFVKGVSNPWQASSKTVRDSRGRIVIPNSDFAPIVRDIFNNWNTIIQTLTGKSGFDTFGHTVIDMEPEDYRRMMRSTHRLEEMRDAFPEALEDIGTYITEHPIPRMFLEGDSNWEALKDSTNKWRKARGYPESHPILKASHELYWQVTSQAAITVHEGNHPRVEIGGQKFPSPEREKFYAHMGGNVGWNGSRVPARPFVPTSPEDLTSGERQHIDNIFREHIEHFLEVR